MEFLAKKVSTKKLKMPCCNAWTKKSMMLHSSLWNPINVEECWKDYLKLEVTIGLTLLSKSKAYVANYEKAKIAAENLAEILKLVTESTNINITVEPAFARGLEYYTGMIFEIYIPGLDIALGGGGRYDRLIEAFGGESTPAVGCAHGIDRVAIALHTQKTTVAAKKGEESCSFANH